MNRPHKTSFPYVLFGILLMLDVTVFLLEKTASDYATGQGARFFLSLALEFRTWAALALALMQLLIWTRILSCIDISLAYPLTSLVYPLTMLCAQFILGESLPWQVWIGALVITLGSAIMGHPRSASDPSRASTLQAVV
jgi:drug/metabolite transporter (DMT)-like permease